MLINSFPNSTCGVKVRTAYLFCSLHRITSLPVGKRHSMKYWKKSSNPSDLCALDRMGFPRGAGGQLMSWPVAPAPQLQGGPRAADAALAWRNRILGSDAGLCGQLISWHWNLGILQGSL
nr:PREDICTED: maturin isoform X1 [Apteryx mantelli mantelli]